MPRKFTPGPAGSAKLSLTITADAADEIRLLAEKEGLTLAQLVRRSLGLYRFVENLGEDDELCIRNRSTDELTRIAILSI